MEEEKLLRLLKLLLILNVFVANTCKANEVIQWANDLSDSAQDMVWQDLLKKFNEQEQLEGAASAIAHPTSKLYVFVSSSMPIPLLKEYARPRVEEDPKMLIWILELLWSTDLHVSCP